MTCLGALCLAGLSFPSSLAGDGIWKVLAPKGGPSPSPSVAEARKRGTLIAELQPQPGEFKFRGEVIKFREAWVEKRVEYVYDKERRLKRVVDGYNLSFTLTKGDKLISGTDSFFVADDRGEGFAMLVGPDTPSLYVQRLEKKDVARVRVSLLSKWDQPRLKNIRFVPKVAASRKR